MATISSLKEKIRSPFAKGKENTRKIQLMLEETLTKNVQLQRVSRSNIKHPNEWLHSSVGRASHRYRGGHGFESRWSLDFFRLLPSNCLNWKIYCDDHSSLWSTTAVQIYELFHIHFTSLDQILLTRQVRGVNFWADSNQSFPMCL